MDRKAWWRKVAPEPDHYKQVIDEPCLLYVDGKMAGLYAHVPDDIAAPIRNAVLSVDYNKGWRAQGLLSQSRVFGNQPRLTIRRDFCTTAAMAKDYPTAHSALLSGAVLAHRYLRHYAAAEVERQEAVVRAKVKDEWMIPDSFYTSGICNFNTQLRYHCDAGNVPDTWNSMLTFRRDMDGGMLAIPELDVALAVRDCTLSIFDAQGLMHGVTPFRKLSPRAYRYTVVYYAIRDMCHCGTRAEELARIREVKTRRELGRRSKA